MLSNYETHLKDAIIYRESILKEIAVELNVTLSEALEIVKASKMEVSEFNTCLKNGCIKDKVLNIINR